MSQQDRDRYMAAMHGVQSGVAMKMNWDTAETQPKQLRVGVNAAMVDTSAVATLLIAKGVFTLDEYEAALADAAERETALYTDEINQHFGGTSQIKLG
jgi:hypothetical protein